MESNEKEEILEWFAMSAPHRKEMEAKRLLENNSIECFIPMCNSIVTIRNRKERRLLPAVSNLVFAHASREKIQEVKRGVSFLQYKVLKEGERNIPITVSEREMQQFIAFCEVRSENIIFLSPEEVDLEKGTPVKIIGGEFDGHKGWFVKVKGKREKRVVVRVKNVAAAAVNILPAYLQVIDEAEMHEGEPREKAVTRRKGRKK